METKFTPGPWRIRKSKDVHSCLTLFVETCNGHQIVELIDNEGNNDWFNNANLIAAAPKMYEALTEVLEHTYDGHSDYSFYKLKDAIRAVINKANPQS